MKKLGLFIATTVLSLALVGCANGQSSHSDSSSSHSSSSQTSSSSQKDTTATLQGDNAMPVANNWHFDQFEIVSLNAEQDDGELELEVNWKNTGSQPASFNDLVKITAKQNNQDLAVTETDDDVNNQLNAQSDDDVDFNYHLTNTQDPITVTVTPAHATNGGKTVTLKLQ